MKRLLLAATLSLLSLPTFAATGAARERLNAFSTGLHALTGRFSQTLANANGDQGRDKMPDSNMSVKPLDQQHKPY